MTIAIYARVSSDSQEARGTIGSQLEALHKKMSELGHQIVHEYTDDGYSGARLDRPGLDALRDAAEAGLFKEVWCLTPDTLARSYAYQILVTDELARHGVQMQYLDAPPLKDDPEATLLVQVQGVIAEYERAKIAERNRRGKLFRARAGEIVFRLVPYGYRRIRRGPAGPAHLDVYEPEAVVVRRIFDDFVAGGYSMRRICRRLYEDGIASPTGKAVWSIACLSKMLENPAYKGRALYNRHQSLPPTTGRKSTRLKLRPREEWIEIPVPAIMSEDLFEAAQRVARNHSYFSPRRSPPDQWLLRRLVVCGHCSVKCYCQDQRRATGHGPRYYVCNRRRSLEAGGPDRACPQPSTRAEELDALVWEQIRQALARPEILVKGQAALTGRAAIPDDEVLNGQLERVDRRLQQTESERRRVADLYQMQAIDLPDFQTRHQEVVGRHQQLEREREMLLIQHQELADNNRLSRKVDAFAQRVRRGINKFDFEQRQKLVRLLVEQVRVTGPTVEIHLRIPLDEPAPSDGAQPHHAPAQPRHQPASLINRVCVHLVEQYFSILQRKVLTPNDLYSLTNLVARIHAFGERYSRLASPSPGHSHARSLSGGYAIRSSNSTRHRPSSIRLPNRPRYFRDSPLRPSAAAMYGSGLECHCTMSTRSLPRSRRTARMRSPRGPSTSGTGRGVRGCTRIRRRTATFVSSPGRRAMATISSSPLASSGTCWVSSSPTRTAPSERAP
jgi:site-specific DNA recombinase